MVTLDMKHNLIHTARLLLFAIVITQQVHAQVDTARVTLRIATFKGDKAAAISYTFDDGIRDQYELAYPMLQEAGIRATFFVITSVIPDKQEEVAAKKPGSAGGISWEKLQEMAAAGHEIASHSWSHPNLPKLNDQQLHDEIYKADSTIDSRLGKAPLTFAYPYNAFDDRVHAAVMQQHILSRDYQQAFGNPRFTLAFANSWADKQVREHTWGVAMIHAVQTGFDAFTSPDILQQHFTYVKQHTDSLWIETFGHVALYAKERDSATIQVSKRGARQLHCRLSTPLDTTVYHYPLTIVVNIPTVRRAKVTQGGKDLPVTIQQGRLLFDARPGGGEIVVKWN
jgi:peptidoglycan/xylan/chitin deacetylase (PgdA/CDA1 family)